MFYFFLSLVVVLNVNTAYGIDWMRIKPMHLVAMMPPMGTEENDEAASAIAPRPIIFNLESEQLNVEMLPGGVVAMDRIFGGNEAKKNSFPYQAGLLLQRSKGLYWCGGSLISNEFILTAAHCVDRAMKALVFLGAHEIRNKKEEGQVRIMVDRSNFLIYPYWNPRRLKNDIALIKLPEPIEFNENIRPIQLPKRSYEYKNFNDKLAIASGWGRYATGVHAMSNILRYVKLQIIDGSTCESSYPMTYRESNICTSGRRGRSTCNGDSGGPLVVQRKKSKKKVLIGLTSYGSIFGCDRGFPAAYTKVVSYLDWILDNTGMDSYWKSKHPSSEVIDDDHIIPTWRYRKRNRVRPWKNEEETLLKVDTTFHMRGGRGEIFERTKLS